jgi:hypothetical protein
MLSSIAASKLFYYIFKYLFISYGLIQSELISTPVYMQIITSIIFSIYVSIIIRKNKPDIYKF